MPFIVVDRLSHTREPDSREANVRGAVPVLSGVSFSIDEGEHVAVIGNNGSGKTTLIRHLNGLLLPYSGEVLVGGLSTNDRKALPAIRSMIGMVFQSPFDQMVGLTVESEAAFGPENLGLPEDEVDERVETVLRKTGIWSERRRSPLTLSAGQQQRLAIAGALAMQPRCLVLDEATSMLDPRGRAELLSLIGMLRADGLTVVSVTNHIEEAAAADRLLVLNGGRLILDGSPAEVFESPEYGAAGLALPAAGAVAARLRAAVPGFPRDVYTVEQLGEAVAAVRKRLEDGAGDGHAVNPAGELTGTGENPEGTANREGAPGPESSVRLESTPNLERTSLDGPPAGGTAESTVIRVRDVSYSYLKGTAAENQALHGVSLTVRRGECVALLGGTGSGKSTLLRHLNGLNPLQEGAIEVLGMDLSDPKYDFRKLRFAAGLAFQRPEDQLFEHYLGEDVAFGPLRQGLKGAALKERVRSAMETAGLDFESFKYRTTDALSGGEKRRGGLAGVIALEPEIFLLDEPAAGLDHSGRSRLFSTIRTLKREGRTVVFVSHSLEDVAELADRVYVLKDGSIVLEGTAREVLTNAEALRSAGLDAPFPAVLEELLRERGCCGMRPGALTVAEVSDALSDFLAGARV